MSKEKQSQEAFRWFRQAKADLETAIVLRENSRFASSCFWAHQSAEKALKALWYHLDKEPWGHSLQKLIEDLEDKRLGHLKDEAIFLDKFYIPTRYPNGLPYPLIPEDTYKKKDALEAIGKAKKIIQAVGKIFDI